MEAAPVIRGCLGIYSDVERLGLRDVSLHPTRPPDARTAPGKRQRPGIQTARVVLNLGTTEIAITRWQASPQQTFANTKSHITRTGTANTPLMHQTAPKYETAVPDGGRLELNPPQRNAKARPLHCAGVPTT